MWSLFPKKDENLQNLMEILKKGQKDVQHNQIETQKLYLESRRQDRESILWSSQFLVSIASEVRSWVSSGLKILVTVSGASLFGSLHVLYSAIEIQNQSVVNGMAWVRMSWVLWILSLLLGFFVIIPGISGFSQALGMVTDDKSERNKQEKKVLASAVFAFYMAIAAVFCWLLGILMFWRFLFMNRLL